MKTITIAGNIGKDAVTRTTQNGDKVTSWTVAVEDRQGKDKSTLWFDCSLWGARGEKLAEYLARGGKVSVSGDFSTQENDGKTYLKIRADQVTLMGGKPASDDRGTYGDKPKGDGYGAGGRPNNDMDDGIPFAMEWRI